MIVPWAGEFLLDPIPLELSLGSCGYRCAYCFARLNGFKGNPVQKVISQLNHYKDSETLTAKMLQDGYPVLLSNHSDPFCSSNRAATIEICKFMQLEKIPVTFATKGTSEVKETLRALKFLDPSVFYVTIETMDEKVIWDISNAPDPADRLAFIRGLIKQGHSVIVGVNPCVPEWVGDYRAFADACKDYGVFGLYCDFFHSTYEQERRMSGNDKKVLGPLLKCKKDNEAKNLDFLREFQRYALSIGLEFFYGPFLEPGDIFEPFYQTYKKCFPTMLNFLNYCCKSKSSGDIIGFEEFVFGLGGSLPDGVYNLDSYLYAQGRQIRKKYGKAITLDFKSYIGFLLRNEEWRFHLANTDYFSYVCDVEDFRLVDDKTEIPFLMFHKLKTSMLDACENYYERGKK